MTWLFYGLFRPVNRTVSLVAAIVSVAGIVAGALQLPRVNPLVFFGFYCLLIGYLIIRSTFMPRWLGAPMLCAAAGWLTFLSPPFARSLYSYNFAPGLMGEGALMLWLLWGESQVESRRSKVSPKSQVQVTSAHSGAR